MIRNAKFSRQIQKFSFIQKNLSDSKTPLFSSKIPTKPSNSINWGFNQYQKSPNETISSRDVYLRTKMISSCVNDFKLDEALNLFDETPQRDLIMWNLMIKGCISCGSLDMALKLFAEMPERNVVSWTTMISAFLKNGMVEQARGLFQEMPERDTAAWNAMIHGLFVNGRAEEASSMFELMPDRNVISWTTMISGLDQMGRNEEALSMFVKMVGIGVKLTSSTLCSVLSSCAKTGELCLGIQLHGQIAKLGYAFDTYIVASLITFYANCKRIEEFVKIYNEKLFKNVVVWTSVLTGYGANDEHESALEVFLKMIRLGVLPNQSTFTSTLNSSNEIETLDFGRGIHGAAVKLGFETDVFVGNALVVLYTKCGSIHDGIRSFKAIEKKNVVSWNTVIVGCAQHGCGEWAVTFLGQMVKAGVRPDGITFTGLLSACSHSGLWRKGRGLFEGLRRGSGVEVKLEHYACMVDILCRSGEVAEAEELVEGMPVEANVSIWVALLSGCRGGEVEVAERVAERILRLDPGCTAGYVLLSNIYAGCGRWEDVARMRTRMKAAGAVKETAGSTYLN
ncbi:pentatricopeptide repeat-containing protein At5g46460, mitochondrial-like isoform X1 [Salvia hispanica]|uniref:pentatricopeptide repeat-containing protein At5g46460, mitochondrial-like isoform X1 n=1 Tax=Salvia hispanica TaxID=49212 RepID=UPI002008F2FD|nr:pentatricopeptide repeat-containing protein At5g46460, mitochondrial-like isoform X1 [Salvia hispanica]